MKHYDIYNTLDNRDSMSSARSDDKLFKIKLWVWNNIIDTKRGWYWFVDDHLCDIDFTSTTTEVKEMAHNMMKRDDTLGWSEAVNRSRLEVVD